MSGIKTNERGFAYLEFEDINRVKCSIQKSSLAMVDAIWLGADDIGLQEFVAYRQPAWMNVELTQTKTHHHVANNRMHLTQEQVKELLPTLIHFAETGELS